MGNLTTIAALYAMMKAAFGSELGKDLLGLFVKRGKLTEEQSKLLIDHEEDFKRRIAERER